MIGDHETLHCELYSVLLRETVELALPNAGRHTDLERSSTKVKFVACTVKSSLGSLGGLRSLK